MRTTTAILAVAASLGAQAWAAPGETRICKWKDNKTCAFSVGGDDSLRSQVTFAIPLMTQRGIYGTWWVNTGRGHDELGFDFIDDQAYWAAAVRAGHDLANHTLHHTGARNAVDAEWEIGENARRIRAIQPGTRLLLFERGGGTVWDASEEEIQRLLARHQCVDARGAAGVDSPTWLINHSPAELRGFVDAAIADGGYHFLAFHGIGPKQEWGGQADGDAFVALLDYLVEKRDVVWSDTFTRVYKYVEERDKSAVTVREARSRRLRLTLSSSLDTSKGMFDLPLTLQTQVPAGWKTCTVRQGHHSAVYPVSAGVVLYRALPNAGDIVLAPGGTPAPQNARGTTLPPAPPAPPEPSVGPTRLVEDFDYPANAAVNSAWWPLPCGNETTLSLAPAASAGPHGVSYTYLPGDKGISGRLRRNTSLDLSPYGYISIGLKASSTADTITLQFMEAIQSEFWEKSFMPASSESQTVVIPLTKEHFHHPRWFSGTEADGVLDTRNVKLMSLFVSGNGGGTVVFENIRASKAADGGAYVPVTATAATPALTETGRCVGK